MTMELWLMKMGGRVAYEPKKNIPTMRFWPRCAHPVIFGSLRGDAPLPPAHRSFFLISSDKPRKFQFGKNPR